MRHRVFVYGTLKRGQRNYHYLRRAEFLGRFVTESVYSMYLFDDYPAVCLNGRHPIRGEVYLIDDLQFQSPTTDAATLSEVGTRYGDAWMYMVRAELCLGKRLIPGHWPHR